MRISLIIFFCLFIVVVNSTAIKGSKAKSPYDHLRAVRGNRTCASGSCPFWDRHGRSFVSLRCYAAEYQECTCLHRMCYSSCLFPRSVCDDEMVSCLQQICPRCSPASQVGMCSIYNSMAVRVTQTLSTFTCYSCCANLLNLPVNATAAPSTPFLIAPPGSNGLMSVGLASVPGGNGLTNGGSQNVINNRPVNGGNLVNGGARPLNSGYSVNGVNRPVNGGNRPVNVGNRPVNAGGNTQVNAGGNIRPVNVNAGTSNVHPNVVPSNGLGSNSPSQKQRIQKTVRPVQRVVTTQRTTKRVQKPSQTKRS